MRCPKCGSHMVMLVCPPHVWMCMACKHIFQKPLEEDDPLMIAIYSALRGAKTAIEIEKEEEKIMKNTTEMDYDGF